MFLTLIFLAALFAAVCVAKTRAYVFKGLVAVVRLFSPAAADKLKVQLGIASTDLDGIVADFQDKIKKLETHADEMFDSAEDHAAAAMESLAKSDAAKAVAARATAIAKNVKSLIAQ